MQTYQYQFEALGAACSIGITADSDFGADIAVERAFGFLERFESEFSRFRPTSVVSQLNRGERVVLSGTFLDLLSQCQTIYTRTGGCFNPLIDVRTLGYTESFSGDAFAPTVCITTPNTAFERLIPQKDSTLHLEDGMYLDFGAIGKGYAAECVANILVSAGFGNCLVDLGGDTVVRGKNAQNALPTIGILSPSLGGYAATVQVRDTSVCTSGSYVRHWIIDGQEVHHLKSPPTWGGEVSSLVSVSVVHTSAAAADAYATALFCSGNAIAERAAEWGIEALWIDESGVVGWSRGFDTKYSLRVIYKTN